MRNFQPSLSKTSPAQRGLVPLLTWPARVLLLPAALLLSLAQPSPLSADELTIQTSFTYDEESVLETVTSADGGVTTFTRDAAGQLTDVSHSGGHSRQMAYDGLGQLSSVTDSVAGTTALVRDPEKHWLIGINHPEGPDIHYGRNRWGELAERRAQGHGGEHYRWDAEGRLVDARSSHGTTAFEYDPTTGRLLSVNLGGGVSEHYTYHPDTGQVHTVTQEAPGGGLIAQYIHDYYHDGLKKSVTETSADRGTETTSYVYDALLRLSTETHVDQDQVSRVTSYEYDANGNRLRRQVTVDGVSMEDTRYRYNGLNQLISAGGEAYFHDQRGNLKRRVGAEREIHYEWDSDNRLVGVEEHRGGQVVLGVAYAYDGFGQRTEKRVQRPGEPEEVTKFANEVGGAYEPLVVERDGVSLVRHLAGSSQEARGRKRWALGGTGGVSRLVDGNGRVVASHRYDAFGRELESGGSEAGDSLFRYRGEQQEAESGLVFLRNRYYDPDLGRFLSIDPHPGYLTDPQSLNPYLYCHNDPVNLSDPTGLDPLQHRFRDAFIGRNGGEAWGPVWDAIKNNSLVGGPTGGAMPAEARQLLLDIKASLPADAWKNGMHSWHAGSNAAVVREYGNLAIPVLILSGWFHETPLDTRSFIAEHRAQGYVNHRLDTLGDFAANYLGMFSGMIANYGNIFSENSKSAGVDFAIAWGNHIPGPGEPDPVFGGPGGRYTGNPSTAWDVRPGPSLINWAQDWDFDGFCP